MPWCHQCGHLVEEDELAAAPHPAAGLPGRPRDADVPGPARDRCPSCGTELTTEDGTDEEEDHVKAPWHFKVLAVGTVVYLGYRLYQGIGWLIHHA